MGGTGVVVFIVAVIVLGGSLWGLINRGRSIFCAMAGVVLVLGAGLGALHAWGEPPRSIPWTTAYLTAVLIGIVAVSRQVLTGKQKRNDDEPEN